MTYNKQHLLGLCLFLGHSSESPWSFLGAESYKGVFCHVPDVTFGKHSGN